MSQGIAFEFLDVGMGDGTLIQLPPWDSGPVWLVDFGERGSPFKIPAGDATLFLIDRITLLSKVRGFKGPFIDFLVLTHPDADHWNKTGWLIQGFNQNASDLWHTRAGWPQGTKLQIGTLVYGGEWGKYQHADQNLAALIVSVTKSFWTLADGDHDVYNTVSDTIKPRWVYNAGNPALETKIYLLSSNLPAKSGGDNNPKSIVLMVDYRGAKVILPGDAEARYVEPYIVGNYPKSFLKSMALKLAHHGSAYSSAPQFLAAVQPQVIFASGDRRWGHPYCNSISNAWSYLGSTVNRWYSCSKSGSDSDYESKDVPQNVCTNLWYVVTNPLGHTAKAPDGSMKTAPYGLYTGVQWRMQIEPDDKYYLSHTDQWPVP